MNSGDQPYNQEFYSSLRQTSGPSANVTVSLVVKILRPQSVVDIGCGEGAWLNAFAREGVKKILGIDGDYVRQDRLLIPPECFQTRDLAQPFTVDERFDLAVSLEVAEHLPESYARFFASSLASLAPAILFSAAIPGQGGTQHINEQWPSYWAALFSSCGFDCFDFLRQRLWDDERIAWWYRQNVLLFAKRGSDAWATLSKISEPSAPAGLIHPALWDAAQRVLFHVKAHAEDPGLKLSVVHVFRALKRRLSSKRSLT